MTYTIVIDVDNFRAERAYKKGLEELEEIWPQIEVHCANVEALKAAAEEAREALEQKMYEEALEEYNRLKALYEEDENNERAYKEWFKTSMWDRGPKPLKPLRRVSEYELIYKKPTEPGCRNVAWEYCGLTPPRSSLKRYESIRNNLKRMHTIANAAIGCYRMTEQDVIEMVGWEDGSRIAKIKEDISK